MANAIFPAEPSGPGPTDQRVESLMDLLRHSLGLVSDELVKTFDALAVDTADELDAPYLADHLYAADRLLTRARALVVMIEMEEDVLAVCHESAIYEMNDKDMVVIPSQRERKGGA